MNQDIRRAINHHVETYNRYARQHGLDLFDRSVEIKYDLKGKCAGQASSNRATNRWVIRINTDIFSRHTSEYLARTVPHEVAHLIVRFVWGSGAKPHGHQWKRVMRILGVQDVKRCHSYEVTPARHIKRYPYTCECQIHNISSILHKRIQSGQQYRICRSCRATLVFMEGI